MSTARVRVMHHVLNTNPWPILLPPWLELLRETLVASAKGEDAGVIAWGTGNDSDGRCAYVCKPGQTELCKTRLRAYNSA